MQNTKKSPFSLEEHLVKAFQGRISKPRNLFKVTRFASEFNFRSGRTDVVATTKNGDLLAFEAKLTKWRDALDQAYRSTSFAHYSYVVLPDNQRTLSEQMRLEFSKRGVGLVVVGNNAFRVEIPAIKKVPLQPWLTTSAIEYISEEL